jgi:hypothetical protein
MATVYAPRNDLRLLTGASPVTSFFTERGLSIPALLRS